MTAIDEVIEKVRSENLTYLEPVALRELADAVLQIESDNLPGVFIEAGCALGGSAIIIASGKSQKRDFYLYDVFGMIPPPSINDGPDIHDRYAQIKEGVSKGINGDAYYGYQSDLYEKVKNNLAHFGFVLDADNIHLMKGLYEDTLKINSSVAFAHIDCDWHDSVMVCLQRIGPFLARNGVLVIDDYYAWSGCRAAVDEYFSDKKDQFLFEEKSRLHIRKLSTSF